MLAQVTRGLLLVTSLFVASLACVRVESGTDPKPLGYGPGAHAMLSAGYDAEPVSRPAPTPWTPPRSQLGHTFAPAEPSTTEPVPYNDDLVRVCEHLGTLGSEGFDPATCLARYRIERVFRPIAEWKSVAACLEAAADLPAVDACLAASPRAFGPIAEYPRESEVCMHIFAITIVEQLGAEPMLDAERLHEFESLLRECVDSLVTEERTDRKPAEYVEMLECIERSPTTSAAEACE